MTPPAEETTGPPGLPTESQTGPPGRPEEESESKMTPLELETGHGHWTGPGETLAAVEGICITNGKIVTIFMTPPSSPTETGPATGPSGPPESESKRTLFQVGLGHGTTGETLAEPTETKPGPPESESKKTPLELGHGTGPGQTSEGSRTNGKIMPILIPIKMLPPSSPTLTGPSGSESGPPDKKKTPLELGHGTGQTSVGTSGSIRANGKIIPIKMTPPSTPIGPSETKKTPLKLGQGTGTGQQNSAGNGNKIKKWVPIKMSPQSGSGSSGGGRLPSKRKPSRFGPPTIIDNNPLGLCSTKNNGRIIKLSSLNTPKVKIEVDDDFGGYHIGKTEIALDPVIIKIENDLHDGKLYKRTIDGEMKIKMSSYNGDGTMNMNCNTTMMSSDGSLGTSASCSSLTSFESGLTEGSAGDSLKSPVVQVRFGQRPPKYNKVDNRKKITTRFNNLNLGSNSNQIVKQKSRTDGLNSQTRKNKNFRFNVTPWAYNKLRKDKDRLLRKNALLREETNDQQIMVANLIDKLGECENDNEKATKLLDNKEAELKREKERHITVEKKFQRDFRLDKKNIFEHYKSELSKVSEIYERTMISFLKDLSLSRALPNGNGGSSIALNTDHPAFYYLRGFRDYQAKEQLKQVNHSFASSTTSIPSLLSLPMAFNHHNATISNPTRTTRPISVIVGKGANRPEIFARRNSTSSSMDMEMDDDENEVTNSTNLLTTTTNAAVPVHVLNKRPSTSKEVKNEGDAVVGNGNPTEVIKSET